MYPAITIAEIKPTRLVNVPRLGILARLLAGATLVAIVGCSSSKPAPVLERNPLNPADAVGGTAAQQATASTLKPSTSAPAIVAALDSRPRDPNAKIYVVKPGDSLYAIAFQNGVEYRELAAWNNLENVNKIRVGQELRVNPPSAVIGTTVTQSVTVPSVGGVAQLPLSVTATSASVSAGGVVTTPLISTPGPAVGIPGGASELQAAQNAAALNLANTSASLSANSSANLSANSATLKVEPKISKQPYSDAAYNRALQEVGGTTNSGLSAGGVIIAGGRPAASGLSAASGAQPPLTGLPALPPNTSASTSIGSAALLSTPTPTPTRITIAPPVADGVVGTFQTAGAAQAARAAAAAGAATAGAQQATTANAAAVDAAMLASSDMPVWIWPLATAGKPRIAATFTDLNKGIDLPGTRGQGVLAAAPGKVVYSGTAMRGYGQLVIVKHNVAWFSAYAHNDKILVAEGDLVKKGQKIAEMGATDADSVKLHFEIRKQGVPVDPLKFLPPL